MIAAGLGLIALVYLLMLGSLAARGEIRITLGVAAILLDVAAGVALIGLLALGSAGSPTADFACPIPGHDSDYAPSHFSWIPPGRVCDFPTGDVGPTYWRIPAAVAIVGLPGVWVLMWPLRRREPRDPETPVDAIFIASQ